MKRYFTAFAVGILLMFLLIPGNAYAQDQNTINRTITELNRKGIAFDEPGASFTFFDDFVDFDSTETSGKSAAADAGWTYTVAGASTAQVLDTLGGVLQINAGAVINNRVNLLHNAEVFEFGQGKQFNFTSRVSLVDNDSTFWVVGFTITDTDLEGGATDMFGFLKEDGDSLIYAFNTKNSVGDTTSTGITMLNNTVYDLAINFQDSSVFTFEIIQSGLTVARVSHMTSARMPTDEELAPVIEFSSGNTAATTFRIDWFFFRRARD